MPRVSASSSMLETSTWVERSLGAALDFDVDVHGRWCGVFRRPDGTLHVHSSHLARFPVPGAVSAPRIRSLGLDRIVIVDSRTVDAAFNGHIFTSAGELVAAFDAGDGVQDVIAFEDSFAVTYFDEGIFSGKSPADEGVALFDGEGRFSWGYRSALAAEAVEIADSYCACWVDGEHLAFSPYASFPLIELNVRARTQRVVALPEELYGASALSRSGRHTIFYGPYARKHSLYRWAPGEAPVELGKHSGPLRGLSSGQFLSIREQGFTIVQPSLET